MNKNGEDVNVDKYDEIILPSLRIIKCKELSLFDGYKLNKN